VSHRLRGGSGAVTQRIYIRREEVYRETIKAPVSPSNPPSRHLPSRQPCQEEERRQRPKRGGKKRGDLSSKDREKEETQEPKKNRE